MKDSIIFLDIDGVIQLERYRKYRNDDEMNAFRAKLSQEVDPDYAFVSIHDIDALRDWQPEQVESLKEICIQANAEIVISSSWKDDRTIRDLLLLFAIQGLDRYVAGATYPLEMFNGSRYSRASEISAYLRTQAWKVHHMVIIDDNDWGDISKLFPGHFLHINSGKGLEKKHVPEALRILSLDMNSCWHDRIIEKGMKPE